MAFRGWCHVQITNLIQIKFCLPYLTFGPDPKVNSISLLGIKWFLCSSKFVGRFINEAEHQQLLLICSALFYGLMDQLCSRVLFRTYIVERSPISGLS